MEDDAAVQSDDPREPQEDALLERLQPKGPWRQLTSGCEHHVNALQPPKSAHHQWLHGQLPEEAVEIHHVRLHFAHCRPQPSNGNLVRCEVTDLRTPNRSPGA